MTGAPPVVVSYAGVLGGAERVLLDCATRLGEPVLVACPDGALSAAVWAAGLEHARLPERTLRLGPAHARGLGALAREIRMLVERRRPSAVVAWGDRVLLAAVPARRRAPLLAGHMDLLPRPSVRAAVRWASRQAAGVVAASEAIASAVRAPRATILRPGVDLDRWTPAPAPEGGPRALVLAALAPWKRQDLALEVAARVPELQLELAGASLPGTPGDYVRRLHTRAAAPDVAGRVTFLGAVADPREALARAHCLLHCSDEEPWGLVLVEAMAAGRPVVAADAGGPREIVSGGAGRLFAPGDAGAAAAALRAVLADPAAPGAARARAERFPVEATAAAFKQALDAVRS